MVIVIEFYGQTTNIFTVCISYKKIKIRKNPSSDTVKINDGEEGTLSSLLGVPLVETVILAEGHFAVTAHGLGHLPLPILPAHLTATIFLFRNLLLMMCSHSLKAALH